MHYALDIFKKVRVGAMLVSCPLSIVHFLRLSGLFSLWSKSARTFCRRIVETALERTPLYILNIMNWDRCLKLSKSMSSKPSGKALPRFKSAMRASYKKEIERMFI